MNNMIKKIKNVLSNNSIEEYYKLYLRLYSDVKEKDNKLNYDDIDYCLKMDCCLKDKSEYCFIKDMLKCCDSFKFKALNNYILDTLINQCKNNKQAFYELVLSCICLDTLAKEEFEPKNMFYGLSDFMCEWLAAFPILYNLYITEVEFNAFVKLCCEFR